MTLMRGSMKIYYNSDLDEIFLVKDGLVFIQTEIPAIKLGVDFCKDCSFWHYIGEL